MNDEPVLRNVSSSLEVLFLVAEPSTASDVVSGWARSGLTVRVVHGRKMRDYQELFDEFAAALQFPWYFGDNGNAFDECIKDLSWLPPQSGYVLVITDPGQVLADARDDGLGWLARSLSDATEEWAKPVESGEWWDRPAVPFHVVLQAGEAEVGTVRARWAAAGAQIAAFD